VPTPDDKFEVYLKQFRPHEPEPLPMRTFTRSKDVRKKMAAKGLAVAAIITVAGLLAYTRGKHFTMGPDNPSRDLSHAEPTQPLTIHSANARLSAAPSFKAAIDEMAFPPAKAPRPKEMRSALDALSEGPEL
jgi:hypothetical protein